MGQQVSCCKAYGKGYVQIEETCLSLVSMELNTRTESHRTGAQDTSLEAGAEAELTSLLVMVCSACFLIQSSSIHRYWLSHISHQSEQCPTELPIGQSKQGSF